MAVGRARHLAGRRRPAAGRVGLRGVLRRGSGCPPTRRSGSTALAALYRDHADDLLRAAWHDVAELLVDHDERTALWRHHHTLMAAREIGSRMGTGGSRGVEYLRSTITRRYFPELWACGSDLTVLKAQARRDGR